MALRPLHEALAVMSILAVVLHGALLLADPWLRPGLAGIVIPFASPYRPLAVALGIVGFYVTLLIGPTYYLRQRLGGHQRWRAVHAFAPAAYGLVTLHVILAGSDASTVWLRFLVGALTGPILVLLGLRVLDAQASAASRPDEQLVDGQAVERAEQHVGLERLTGDRRHRDDLHPGGPGRGGAGRRVLEGHAALGRLAEVAAGGQVDVRLGLRRQPVAGADHAREHLGRQPAGPKRRVREAQRRVRGHGQRHLPRRRASAAACRRPPADGCCGSAGRPRSAP